MAKKSRRKKGQQFPKSNKVTYNKYKPNRQARRLGIKAETPPKQEEPKRVSKAEVLRDRVQQAKEAERRKEHNEAVSTLITMLKQIISLAGFELVGRIVLKDKEKGKEYR